MDYLGTQATDKAVNTIANDQLAYRKTAASRGYTLATNCSAVATTVLTASQLRAFPWVITSKIVINGIFAEVTTASAGSSFRVGIYSDTGSLYPGALVATSDAIAYDSGTVGVKTSALGTTITLLPGLYWVAVNSSANPTLRAIAPSAIAPVLGVPLTLGATPHTTGYAVASTFGALPATYPAGGSFQQNVAAPLTVFQSA